VEFVVFGRFAGFDGFGGLGEDWLRYHACVLEMGTGRIIIKTDNTVAIILQKNNLTPSQIGKSSSSA
jgi:hypothetical protein